VFNQVCRGLATLVLVLFPLAIAVRAQQTHDANGTGGQVAAATQDAVIQDALIQDAPKQPEATKQDAPTQDATGQQSQGDSQKADAQGANAQKTDSQNQAPAKSGAQAASQDKTGSAQNAENPKRILGIIPNFQTTNDVPENQKPLTVREKYILSFHQMFDISAHVGNVFQSTIQQATNGQPHFGQGWEAYGKRILASEGDQVTSSFFISGFLPHILNEDPRYFRKGTGPALSRVWYAMERTVITRKDSGRPTFNFSQTLGQLASAAISTTYYPQQDRSISGAFSNTGLNLAYNSGYNVLREYYPDILRVLFRRHGGANAQAKTIAKSKPEKSEK